MSLAITVQLDTAGLAGLQRRLDPAETQRRMLAAMTESVQLGVRRVVSRTPKKTGAAAASVGGEVQSSVVGVIKSGLSYFPFIEDDTRPHVIMPRKAKALFWPGAAHPVRVVHHPGTTGSHPFRDTAAEMAPLAGAIFARHLGEP